MNSRTKYVKKNQNELQPSEIEFLLSGQSHSTFRFFAASDDELRTIWRRIAPKILPVWIRHRPGSRPYGWWRFDAPEPRQLADGTKQDVPDWMTYSFGLPTAFQYREGKRIDFDYESESDYLYRTEKLTDFELTLDAEQLRKNTIDEPDAEVIQDVLAELVK